MNNQNEIICAKSFHSYYHYRYRNNNAFKGHTHSMWEMNIVLNGEIEITYEDRIISLKENMILLYEPGVYHRNRVISKNKTNYIVYHFYSENFPVVGEPRVYTVDDYNRHIISLIEHECEYTENFNHHLNLSVNPKAKLLLDLFLTKLSEEKIKMLPIHDKNVMIFETAVRYMKNNIHKNITIKEIADVCCISPSKLKTVFSQYTGSGIIEYFSMLKFNKATEYLKENKSIKEISDILGFSSQAYFSMWFKKYAGVPPIRYNFQKNEI